MSRAIILIAATALTPNTIRASINGNTVDIPVGVRADIDADYIDLLRNSGTVLEVLVAPEDYVDPAAVEAEPEPEPADEALTAPDKTVEAEKPTK